MATRFKLRLCTWNVGNAQPPADLSAWLGIALDDYDIIAVAAQEANYGSDKTTSPTSVATISALDPSFIAQRRATTPTNTLPPKQTTPGRLRKISRAIKSSKGPWKEGALMKLRSKVLHDAHTYSSAPRKDADLLTSPNSDNDESHTNDIGAKHPSSTKPQRLAILDNRLPLRKMQSERVHTALTPQKVHRQTTCGLDDLDSSSLAKKQDSFPSSVTEDDDPNDPFDDYIFADMKEKSPQSSSRDGEDESSEESQDSEETDSREDDYVAGKQTTRYSRSFKHSVANLLRPMDANMIFDEGEKSPGPQGTSEKKFSRAIEKNMPAEYHLIAKHHLMEIKLLIYVHARHRSRVMRTERVAEATGIGNVVGNKGGVAVKLTLDDTSFCFVSSHLAAHEGAKFLQQRNADVVEIMRNIERDKVHGLPVMHQFNHIFWMGDLNYRLDLKQVVPAAVTWTMEERWKYVTKLIGQKRYEELSRFDELRREMKAENVFGGFEEGKLSFPPTFKVVRGRRGNEYQRVRVPSYCDRILWHSLPLHRKNVKLREYGCVSEVDTSDHKPVYGVFDVMVLPRIWIYTIPAPRDALKCTIDFLGLQVDGLYEKKSESDDGGAKYEVLEDGALALSPVANEQVGSGRKMERNGSGGDGKTHTAGHTRRVVTAAFHGNGMFVKERPHRTEVPIHEGRRECGYEELPRIALRPVQSLGDLMYKYVTIVFARLGSRQGSSCVLPIAKMVEIPGRHRVVTEMQVTKYGMGVAKVRVEVELVVSLETWIDSRNNIVRPRLR